MKSYTLYYSPLVKMLKEKNQQEWVLSKSGKKYSINDILNNAKNIAKNISDNGFKADDRVVIIAEPGLDFISVLYAIIMLKGIVAIIDPDMGSTLYKSRLEQFGAKWIFMDYRLILLQHHPLARMIYQKLSHPAFFIPRIPDLKRIAMGKSLKWHGIKLNISSLKNENLKNEIWEESISTQDFLVTYTSGTIDAPKGVLHSDRSLKNSLQLLSLKIGKYAGSNMVSHLPHFALLGIQANVKVYLWEKKWKPKKRIQFIIENDINIFFGPPVELNELLDYCEINNVQFPSCLKFIMLGSAPVYSSFLKRLKCHTKAEVDCLYGMTENLLVSSISMDEKLNYQGAGDVVGYPIKGLKVKISAEHEILISSDQLFTKYWHKSDRIDKFHPTGDLGFIDNKGRIVLTGRKKNMIIRKEYNIYPGLYEPTINKISQVEQAVMVGMYNPIIADEEVYLIVESNEKINKIKLMKQLRTGEFAIDHSALPDQIIFANLPRKGRQQKIDYKELNEMIKSQKFVQ